MKNLENFQFKVKCKKNYYEPNYCYLGYKINEIYDAEIVVGEDKDYFYVYTKDKIPASFFSFKNFSEYFKILSWEETVDITEYDWYDEAEERYLDSILDYEEEIFR